MEGGGQQIIQHACKLCDKSFPCGRSLGGHMRSHVIHSSPKADQTDGKKLTKKKLSNLSNEENGYVLRENPKKTCRFADPSFEDSFLHEKFCKQCGKGFHSWKALFGHMKCHSEKFSYSLEEDSWTTSANHSESETAAAAAAMSRKKKRSRRVTRYISTNTKTNSSLSMANNNSNNGGSSSVSSEVDHQEQEEVALCLIMLSRDVGGSKSSCFNSVDESSDNNFELLEAGSSSVRSKNEMKNPWSSGGGEAAKKFRKLRNGKLDSATLDSNSDSQLEMKQEEYGAYVFSRNGSKQSELSKKSIVEGGGSRFRGVCEVELDKDLVKKNAEFISKKPVLLYPKKPTRNGKLKESDFRKHGGFLGDHDKCKRSCKVADDSSRLEASEVELSKNLMKESGIEEDQPEFTSEKHRYLNPKKPNVEDDDSRRSKGFECTTCNKAFHSYQALGGHRASHKKTKGCCFSSSKIDESQNSINEYSTTENNISLILLKKQKEEYFLEQQEPKNSSTCGVFMSTKNNNHQKEKGAHECPICFRVFSSGQALGGHKRSHLISDQAKTSKPTVVIQKTLNPEVIRDLLDLNLPAPVEAEERAQWERGFQTMVAGRNQPEARPAPW